MVCQIFSPSSQFTCKDRENTVDKTKRGKIHVLIKIEGKTTTICRGGGATVEKHEMPHTFYFSFYHWIHLAPRPVFHAQQSESWLSVPFTDLSCYASVKKFECTLLFNLSPVCRKPEGKNRPQQLKVGFEQYGIEKRDYWTDFAVSEKHYW